MSRVYGLSCLPLYPQALKQDLAHSRNSRNDCQICRWLNKALWEFTYVMSTRKGVGQVSVGWPTTVTYSGSGGQESSSWKIDF